MRRNCHNIFGKFVREVKYIRETLSLLAEADDYLKAGRFFYRTHPQRMFYQKNEASRRFIEDLRKGLPREKRERLCVRVADSLRHFLVFFCMNLLYRHRKKDHVPNGFDADLVLASNTRNKLKMFDFEHAMVMTLFRNESMFNDGRTAMLTLRDYIRSPLRDIDASRKIVIQDYVRFTPYPELKNSDILKTLDAFYTDYLKYLQNVAGKDVEWTTAGELHAAIEKRSREQGVWSVLEPRLLTAELSSPEKLPSVKFKRDLSFKNFLVTKDGYYCVDYDQLVYSNVMTPFLRPLNSLAFEYGNPEFLAMYKSGRFDDHFRRAFDCFGLSYDPGRRFFYYAASILSSFHSFLTGESFDGDILKIRVRGVLDTLNRYTSF